jgi:predicted ATP-binding protein involved in virulence
MRIRRFTATNVHGYLDLDVSFNRDLTLLTGINGSGKTTVVRGMVALLTPSFSALAGTEFESMTVEIDHDDERRSIRATRTENDITLSIDKLEQPITVAIFKKAEYEIPSRFTEREKEYYREVHTTEGKNPTLRFLSELPTPMFLDLERRTQGLVRKRVYVSPTELDRQYSATASHGEGLLQATGLAEEAYQSFLTKQSKLQSDLRNQLVVTAFETLTQQSGFHLPDSWERANLEYQRDLVIQTLEAIKVSEAPVKKFYDELLELLPTLVGKNINELVETESGRARFSKWVSMQPQVKQIDAIVKLITQYNENITKARRPIENFLASINRFLADSGKELQFNQNGRPVVYAGSHRIKTLAGLSSGERQLLVILTHLAFNPQGSKANVLIIDEPELSLHIRWQEHFVSALQEAGRDVQLILATHSPSIILDRTDACVDVHAT